MINVYRLLVKFVILVGMLLGLPLLGIVLAGYPVGRYLQFPPQTQYVRHAPFTWSAFAVFAFMIAAVVLPITIQSIHSYNKEPPTTSKSNPVAFPKWGWLGVIIGVPAWVLAWTRFQWFADWQPHTFSPLWLAYIIVVNAICVRRTGRSLMTDNTLLFLLLFPVSAVFWWFFEYLNRFVQNWYYVGVNFRPWQYFWFATLAYSTVLPAVLSTRQWFLSFSWIQRGFGHFPPIPITHPVRPMCGFLLLAAVGLTGIGIWPNYLFPLLWVSPALIIIALQALMKERHILTEMGVGDWRGAVAAVLASILCGWFWEMWNYFSLAKWKYSVPLVQRFEIFEMPFLGYAGYLPFGLECMVVGAALEQLLNHGPKAYRSR
jgi:hypothetical protein